MVEVEVLGRAAHATDEGASGGLKSLSTREVRLLCTRATSGMGVTEGHLAVEFVDAERIAQLNGEYRGKHEPTDVLSFPVDGTDQLQSPRELGDVVICPEHTADVREAIVHGVLHLLGMDHETDDGEMLAMQRAVLAGERT